jgi:hypothetical protein
MVERSRRGLLIASGLPSNGDNHHVIDAALDRLCKPIGQSDPILRSWKRLKNGLRLEVNGLWLNKPYERVPWPLPLRSPSALRLYLLLQTLDTRPSNTATTSIKNLCYKLGITTDWGGAVSQRILHKALEAVNAHLDTLDSKLLHKYSIRLPSGYEIIEDENDSQRIRFQEIVRQGRDRVEDETDEDVEFVPSRRRQRPKSAVTHVLQRSKIEPKIRPRINPDLKKPRITHEMLMRQHQIDRDRLLQEAKPKTKPRTRTYTDQVGSRHERVTVEYEVPVTDADLDRELGRVAGE